jgi:hypothetical protein
VSVAHITGSNLSEEEVAAVVVVIEMFTTTPPALEEVGDITPAWRFSGRWFDHGRRLA